MKPIHINATPPQIAAGMAFKIEGVAVEAAWQRGGEHYFLKEPGKEPYIEPYIEPHIEPYLGPYIEPYIEPYMGPYGAL